MAKINERKNQTVVQVTTLDAILNVNTLFTSSVFLGISFSTNDSLSTSSSCSAGQDVARRLVMFEVMSFSFFLLSTLIIQGLKIHLNLINSKYTDEPMIAEVERRVLNLGIIGSAIGSILGCAFLMLSMVHVIEIRLGLLSCGNKYSIPAVAVLCVSVFLGFVSYLFNIFLGYMDQREQCAVPASSRSGGIVDSKDMFDLHGRPKQFIFHPRVREKKNSSDA